MYSPFCWKLHRTWYRKTRSISLQVIFSLRVSLIFVAPVFSGAERGSAGRRRPFFWHVFFTWRREETFVVLFDATCSKTSQMYYYRTVSLAFSFVFRWEVYTHKKRRNGSRPYPRNAGAHLRLFHRDVTCDRDYDIFRMYNRLDYFRVGNERLTSKHKLILATIFYYRLSVAEALADV